MLKAIRTNLTDFPDFARMLLLGVILMCGAVTLPQLIQFGSISGLAVITILSCCGVWFFWLARPWFPWNRAWVLVPLGLFTVYSIGSMLWFAPSVKGLQLLSVTVGFLGLMLVAGRQADDEPGFSAQVFRMLDIGTFFSVGLYLATVAVWGIGNDSILVARGFAIFALLGVARQLALWQAGDQKALYLAIAITGVIILSVSRTAMAAAILMFPLAAVLRGGKRGWLTAGAMGILGILSVAVAVMVSEEMYKRFFGYDASMNVGGIAINSSGRAEMWGLLYQSAMKSPWLGQGVASSALLIDQYFPLLGHPHNDFLRFLHDFGVVGLGCWLVFVITAIAMLYQQVRRSRTAGDLQRSMTPLLALVGISATMFTDNSVSYAFVMAPLGILLGCSLARGASWRRKPVKMGKSAAVKKSRTGPVRLLGTRDVRALANAGRGAV